MLLLDGPTPVASGALAGPSFDTTVVDCGRVFSLDWLPLPDGQMGLVVVVDEGKEGPKHAVKLLSPRADGGFETMFELPLGSLGGVNPAELAVGDFDNDGIAEVILGGPALGDKLVRLVPASEGWRAVEVPLPATARRLATVDLDGKGGGDLAVTHVVGTTETITLFRGDEDGLEAVSHVDMAFHDVRDLRVIDLQNNGERWLAWLNASDAVNLTSQSAVRFARIEDGQLGPIQQADLPGMLDGMAFSFDDVNGDGWLDMAVCGTGGINDFPGMVTVQTRGDRGFSPTVSPNWGNAGANHPESIAVADLDGDGRKEVYLPGGGDQKVVHVIKLDEHGAEARRTQIETRSHTTQVKVFEHDGGGRGLLIATTTGIEILTLKRPEPTYRPPGRSTDRDEPVRRPRRPT